MENQGMMSGIPHGFIFLRERPAFVDPVEADFDNVLAPDCAFFCDAPAEVDVCQRQIPVLAPHP